MVSLSCRSSSGGGGSNRKDDGYIFEQQNDVRMNELGSKISALKNVGNLGTLTDVGTAQRRGWLDGEERNSCHAL
jgi:hypothetical protein